MDEFKPAIALNVFIEPYFRKEVLEKVFGNIDKFSPDLRKDLLAEVKDQVKISGFRNPMVAPRALLIKNAETVFEKDSRFCLTSLKSWQYLYAKWHKALKNGLVDLGFSISEPAAAEYPDPMNTFLVGWHEDISFDALYENLSAKIEGFDLSKDETALLTILLTGYMP